MKRIIAAIAAIALAGPALGRPNPTPKPSGIVIHLFGPNSITSHVLPSFAASRPTTAPGVPAPGAPSTTGPQGIGSAPYTTAASAAAGAQPTDASPTMGDVLHQMFVTGDPDHPGSSMVPGRAADQPHVYGQ